MSINDQQWNLGTAPRGLDGDTSREAGEKYNIHRHPPTDLSTIEEFNAWGALDTTEVGDTCRYNGLIYIWDGNDAVPIGTGPGNPGELLVSEIPLAFNIISNVGDPNWEEVGGDSFDPRNFILARADKVVKFRVTAYLVGGNDDASGNVRLYNLTTNTSIVSFEITQSNTPITVESAALTSDDGLRNANDVYVVQVQMVDNRPVKVLKASIVVYSELG